MSDAFYRAVRFVGTSAFWVSGSPIVIGREHIPASGPCIIAANHTSPYDVALLIRHVPRLIDFVSITEVFKNPLVAWFYGSLNAFPLERSRPDAPTVRTLLCRLERGRLVGMFPEGGFRRGSASVLHSGTIRPGIGRISRLSGAPVIPAVILNSRAYTRVGAWAPLGRTVYALAFDRPIPPQLEAREIEARLIEAMLRLYEELRPRLPKEAHEV